ncbi:MULTISPECIES: hypothetical protein [Rhizobium/Agrobacterium group]|uniref:Uncharacterized protein n=1 Tax=Agrobacterium genomosp. 2 str. CFBP 5494 TaxID=1183436 RepID=A0A9W5EZR3_9HYPH|nr:MULTISPECIES: hypothetical protein [Rhizobium/Agrobacterium group]OJH54723.1 hypothetical protein ATN81_11875 [Agrobacterium pusense]OJH59224.1 hypothetical protein BA725_13475 [Agrobacterium pusense]CAD7053024.1 hypothetical protein RP007_01502 [Rhizobium sp. P007]CUW92154.1 conserved hypothetical protein [Agrobacterium genomosp. 2 str. CFBP 5494]
MLYEYAVEPQAIGSSWQTFLYLIEKFGFDRGRLISRLPGKWEKKVIQAAKEAGVSDIRMASIIERLKNAKSVVVDFGRPYDAEKSWLDNAQTEHERAPFHAIIAQQNPSGNASVLPVADINDQQPLMAVTQDRAVSRESETIAQTLSGFLRVGTLILFVDAFFDPYNARYRSTLRACLAVVKLYNSAATCEIHYRYHGNKPANAELEGDVARLFDGVIPEDMAVSIYCWREKAGGADFHARYLLTNCGGVGIDAGFSAEGGHQTTDMYLMSLLQSQAKLASFEKNATDFELVGPVLEVRSDGSVRRI